MYGASQTHHSGGGRLLQRFLCSYRALVAIITIFLFTIFLYYYNESLSLLKSRELEGNRCQQKLDSVSAQLQVVYEHKSRLEKSLAADREACTKKMDDISRSLKAAQEGQDKHHAEVKEFQQKIETLQKELENVKAEKQASEAAVATNLDAALRKAKETCDLEIATLKSANANLHAQVANLQGELAKNAGQTVQQQQVALQNQQPAQPAPVGGIANQPPHVLVPPNASVVLPSAPIGAQVPLANVVPPAPSAAQQPQREQVAVPMAEHQQQQLYAQRQVPLQQQQPAAAAPAPVLQHPLGEDQQQLMMVRQNPVAGPIVGIPPAQAQQPLVDNRNQAVQHQAPPPAAVAQDAPGGDGRLERELAAGQNLAAADAYRDDEEEHKQKDFDTAKR